MLTPEQIKAEQVRLGLPTTSTTTAPPQVDPTRLLEVRSAQGLTKTPTTAASVATNVKEGFKGALKGAGRSALNVAKLGLSGLGLFGKMPFKEKIQGAVDTASVALEPSNKAQKIGGYLETAAEVLAPLPGAKTAIGESLISKARGMYESALKLPITMAKADRARAISTGLKEAISISESGIDRAAGLIDDLESKLGSAIKAAGAEGKTIPTESLKPFIDEAKDAFSNLADVNYSEDAINKIDILWDNFAKKYGDNIPVKAAQEIKKNTYGLLKREFGELSSPVKEGNKQLARGLKEGIVKVAPLADGINKRLGDLYQFEQGLEKASNRAGNLDVISLGSKVMAGAGGKVGGALAIVNELFKPALKSFTAVQMNRLGEFLATKTDKEIKALRSAAKVMGPVNLVNMIQGLSDALKD